MARDNLIIHLSSGSNLELVFIQGGLFQMGNDTPGGLEEEKPVHKVQLSDYYIGRYPVTQDIWMELIGENQSHFIAERRPVENVTWDDAQNFLRELNKRTGKEFGLPTEAQWEYAARGGRYSEGYKYSGSDRLKQVGWYDEISEGESHEVGQLLANELGLHDMSGNVWEWCYDCYSVTYYTQCHEQGIVNNPKGPDGGGSRVLRGGSWGYPSARCRSVCRYRRHPGLGSSRIGFRLVLPIEPLFKT